MSDFSSKLIDAIINWFPIIFAVGVIVAIGTYIAFGFGHFLKNSHEARKQEYTKTKLIIALGLSIFGKIIFCVVSLYWLSYLVLICPHNPMLGIRLLIGFTVSILFIFGAAVLGQARNWLENYIRALPLVALALGCLGLADSIFNFWDHRQPHSLTEYETSLLVVSICGLLICFWLLHRNRKKSAHK
jgi:xanthine/uracil/vitamin C permease (AzgA family)